MNLERERRSKALVLALVLGVMPALSSRCDAGPPARYPFGYYGPFGRYPFANRYYDQYRPRYYPIRPGISPGGQGISTVGSPLRDPIVDPVGW